ncbi:MAG TPA: M14 family zinc carboxypeptidase, partial [Candidatus Eisenbacteria bacterium]|nr:M14 family zinc carboxypeptidase [Candidatus Eisenbacteria bacterium]
SKEYLPASVAYVPASSTVPSPFQVLGRHVGTPDELTSVAREHAYFRKLDEASPRVLVERIGTSEEGREMLVALISDEANLERLDHYREITARIEDPRALDRAAMERLAAEGRLFYYLMGGLHSSETGPPEMLMELAYRLAVSEHPDIQSIRRNVIVMITPVLEPDGRDRVVEWYYRHQKGRKATYRDLDRFMSPPYWGHYAFHDNNRDGMQLTLALTQAMNATYWKYHPQVVHDLHESLPLLYISTGHGPYSDAVDAMTINEWTQFAYHEASELQAHGLPGVWTWGFWDGWWPGYLFSVANNHNSIGRFYETFGNASAATLDRNLKDVKFVGRPVTEEQWYRPWPPEKKLVWSMRNNTNYMQAGVLQALEYAASHREELLRNHWVKAERAIQKGKAKAPRAWIFPEEQKDPGRLAYLVNQLHRHRIEVHRLTAPAAVGDTTYEAGSYVVRMDQPFRNAALNFLEEQKFPADEPHPPYDDIAWTWPLIYGVTGARVDSAGILGAAMDQVDEDLKLEGNVSGDGAVYLLADHGQTSLLAARVALGKMSVEAVETSFVADGRTYPAGSWIVKGSRSTIEKVAQAYGLEFVGGALPAVRRHPLDLPRLAVYHTWIDTQDAGWVRYTLDHDKIPYNYINDEDVKRGGLRGRFDLILFPDTYGGLTDMIHGLDPKYGPLAYTKTAEYPSHGIPDASPDITGGMGFQGLSNIRQFIQEGGVFACLGSSGRLLVDGGLVRDVRSASAGSTPGSVVRTKILRPRHPITYGYETLSTAFRGNQALWDVDDEDRGWVVMQFGTKTVPEEDEAKGSSKKDSGPLVLSGHIKETDKLNGKPAIMDVASGKGRVVLYAFNPLHRYLNHADFRYAYNLILNWNDKPR